MSEARFVRSPTVLTRTVGLQVLLASLGREDVDRLSPTAAAMWDLLARPRTLAFLTQALAEAYQTPEGGIAGDVASLLGDLRDRGWVVELPDEDG